MQNIVRKGAAIVFVAMAASAGCSQRPQGDECIMKCPRTDSDPNLCARVLEDSELTDTEHFRFYTDLEPPRSLFEHTPKAFTKSQNANFQFFFTDATSPVPSFSYRLDGADWSAFEPGSELHLQHLTSGPHSLEVRSQDVCENIEREGMPVFDWIVDREPPEVKVQNGKPRTTRAPAEDLSDGGLYNVPVQPQAIITDEHPDPAQDHVELTVDGERVQHFASGAVVVNDGDYVLTVGAGDRAGNTTTVTLAFIIDREAPTFVFRDARTGGLIREGATFTRALQPLVLIEDQHPDPATDTVTLSRDGGELFGFIPGVTLIAQRGTYVLAVSATDLAGNTHSTQVAFLLDPTPPQTALAVVSAGCDPQASFAPACDVPPCTFECRLDFAVWEACPSPWTLSGLADGTHTVEARATDLGGITDPTPVAHSFAVDTTAPRVRLTYAPPVVTNLTTAAFELKIDDAVSLAREFSFVIDPAPGRDYGPFGPGSAFTVAGLLEGAHRVAVRARDACGNVQDAPTEHRWTIERTPPVVVLSDQLSGAELGETARFDSRVLPALSVSDAHPDPSRDTLTVTHNGAPLWFTLGQTLEDPGVYVLTASATDLAGNRTTVSSTFELILEVTDYPRITSALSTSPDDEGMTTGLMVKALDDPAGPGTIDWFVAWGDPRDPLATESGTAPSGTRFLVEHTYCEDGVYRPLVRVLGANGEVDRFTYRVESVNRAPVFASVAHDGPADENRALTVTVRATDQGCDDGLLSWVIEWNDGSNPGASQNGSVAAGSDFAASHVYPQDGTYYPLVRVTDSDGATNGYELVVTVLNVAPALDPAPALQGGECATFALPPVTFADQGPLDLHSAVIDWGAGAGPESGTVTAAIEVDGGVARVRGRVDGGHTYCVDGEYTIAVRVTDEAGATSEVTLPVDVYNLPPVVVAAASVTVETLAPSTLPLATFTDPGTLDTHTATVDWGDGSPLEPGVIEQGPGFGRVRDGVHMYSAPGSYTVTVCVTDSDAASHCDAFSVRARTTQACLLVDFREITYFEGDDVLTSSDAGIRASHGLGAAFDPDAWPRGSSASRGTRFRLYGFAESMLGGHIADADVHGLYYEVVADPEVPGALYADLGGPATVHVCPHQLQPHLLIPGALAKPYSLGGTQALDAAALNVAGVMLSHNVGLLPIPKDVLAELRALGQPLVDARGKPVTKALVDYLSVQVWGHGNPALREFVELEVRPSHADLGLDQYGFRTVTRLDSEELPSTCRYHDDLADGGDTRYHDVWRGNHTGDADWGGPCGAREPASNQRVRANYLLDTQAVQVLATAGDLDAAANLYFGRIRVPDKPDHDNDGVDDAFDPAPIDPDICGDVDADTCDDCAIGTDGYGPLPDSFPRNDGPDLDADGLCDAGDADEDGDGAPVPGDSHPRDPLRCGDTDADTCEDCSRGRFAPGNDGADFDGDGQCDAGDLDLDGDGVANGDDVDAKNPRRCIDTDADGCDDCTLGTDGLGPESDATPLHDGLDFDGDGVCNTGDADDCRSCETDADGAIVSLVVTGAVRVELDGAPSCTGDAALCATARYDTSGPRPSSWRVVFEAGGRRVVLGSGSSITVANLPATGPAQESPGISLRTSCDVEIDAGARVALTSVNQRAGDLRIHADGHLLVDGALGNYTVGALGVPGVLVLSTCCGDIVTGPRSLLQTRAMELGGGGVSLAACDADAECGGGDIVVEGLIDASYKGGTAPTVRIGALEGAVRVDGRNDLGLEDGSGRALTSGISVRSNGEARPARVGIEALGDVVVLGNRVLDASNPNLATIAIVRSADGVIDVRSASGRLLASDRAFANRGPSVSGAGTYVDLHAGTDVELSVTGSIDDGAADTSKLVIDARELGDAGGIARLRAYTGAVRIGAGAGVSASRVPPGTELVACAGVESLGTVEPKDATSEDDAGVCESEAPSPLFADCAAVGALPSPVHAVADDVFIDEGQALVLDGSRSFEDFDDALTGAWRFDGAVFDGLVAVLAAGSRPAIQDDLAAVAELSTFNSIGDGDLRAINVTVRNLDPVFTPGPDVGVETLVATSFVLGSVSDAGVLDTHHGTVSWGDGSAVDPVRVSESGGSGSVRAEHAYLEPGTYTITVCVSDDDGGSDCGQLEASASTNLPCVRVDFRELTLFHGDQVIASSDPGIRSRNGLGDAYDPSVWPFDPSGLTGPSTPAPRFRLYGFAASAAGGYIADAREHGRHYLLEADPDIPGAVFADLGGPTAVYVCVPYVQKNIVAPHEQLRPHNFAGSIKLPQEQLEVPGLMLNHNRDRIDIPDPILAELEALGQHLPANGSKTRGDVEFLTVQLYSSGSNEYRKFADVEVRFVHEALERFHYGFHTVVTTNIGSADSVCDYLDNDPSSRMPVRYNDVWEGAHAADPSWGPACGELEDPRNQAMRADYGVPFDGAQLLPSVAGHYATARLYFGAILPAR